MERATPVGDIKNFCDKKNDHYVLTVENLRQSELGLNMLNVLDNKFKKTGGFRNGIYTTVQLEALIQELCEDEKIRDYAQTIRKAEFNLRNQAAHTVIAVDDELIKRRIGMTAAELFDVIKKMAVRLGLVSKETWNSYEDMNNLILDKLN